MELSKATEIYDRLYEDVNGHSISIQGRDAHGYDGKSFVYGEVMPDSFYEIISSINPRPGEVFYDFGSGTGKALMLAHLLFDFSECKGIEYVDTLYEASVETLKRYETEVRPSLGDAVGNSKISATLGSFLESNVDDAGIIFMNSTCFQEDLMEALDAKLVTLTPGTRIITLSKSLKSPIYHLERHQKFTFSWGDATVFFHTKGEK
jgi:precorrin-6B methylase 2